MKSATKALRILSLGAVAAIAIWLWPFFSLFIQDHHVWHQKLELTVETAEGMRTGTAIVEVRAAFGQQPLSGNEVSYELSGEATVVELAPGRYLFALLGGTEERYACAAGKALGWGGPWNPSNGGLQRGEWLADVPRQVGRPAVSVSKGCLPAMVTFDDITDPKTVRRVDPDDLAATFGPGVRLKAVTLAVTDEPVAPWQDGQVAEVLPKAFFDAWGAVHRGALAQGIRDPYFSSLLGQLSRSDLQIGG
ncbi:hypothetical protein R5H32_04240 [Defluviimonas sp. D31]|uniref:hypothetical protein n=1 Tax=Defluviimonas sp. D31 TaxID=3083253 RepID=UPI00296F081A|nr:hypothetical protein [Defluviimonas sp. D31]MDW4548557.1 hypothetical protein [Defluviimonas sp. D31]